MDAQVAKIVNSPVYIEDCSSRSDNSVSVDSLEFEKKEPTPFEIH